MTNERFAELIRALTEAGINAYGPDPIVPYEMLITREDALFAHAVRIASMIRRTWHEKANNRSFVPEFDRQR